jgi:hypothetical protein
MRDEMTDLWEVMTMGPAEVLVEYRDSAHLHVTIGPAQFEAAKLVFRGALVMVPLTSLDKLRPPPDLFPGQSVEVHGPDLDTAVEVARWAERHGGDDIIITGRDFVRELRASRRTW